jgi:O-antigen/teichoic acid export membrane protein
MTELQGADVAGPATPVSRNVLANFLGQAWTTLVGIIFLPAYLHFLGTEAFGLIGVFAVLQAWLSVLDFGLTPTISREMARFTAGARDVQSIRDLLRSVELAISGVAVVVVGLIGVSATWIANEWLQVQSLSPDEVADGLVMLGVVVGLRLIEGIYRSSLIGLQRQVLANMITAGFATLRAIGAVVVLATVTASLEAFFLWQAAVSAAGVVALAVLVHRAIPPAPRRSHFSVRPLSGVARFAAGTLTITFLGFMLSQSDKVILSTLLSLSAFAVYTLAYIVASGVRLIAQPVNVAVFPRLTELYATRDGPALSLLYHKANQLTAVLMGSAGLVLIGFDREILTRWTGNPGVATDASRVLDVLVLGMMLNAFMNGPYFLQLAAGWTGLLVRANLVMVLVFIPLVIVLTETMGALGAATAWVLINLSYVLVVTSLMHRRLLHGELRTWYVDDLLRPICSGAVALVVLRLIGPPQGDIAFVVFMVVALVIVITASALAASHLRPILVRPVQTALHRP